MRNGRRLRESEPLHDPRSGEGFEALQHVLGERRRARETALHAPQVEALDVRVVEDRVKNRRYSGEQRDTVFHDAAHDRLDVSWVGKHHHRGRHAHGEVHRGGHAERVKQRDGRKHDFVAPLSSGEPRHGLLQICSEVSVRKHRTFGHAGGAARVLQHGEVVRYRPRL